MNYDNTPIEEKVNRLDEMIKSNSPQPNNNSQTQPRTSRRQGGSRESDIQRLKNLLNAEKAKNAQLIDDKMKRIVNTPVFKQEQDHIELSYTGKLYGHDMHATIPIAKGDAARDLYDVVKHFVQVSNDLLRGHDIRSPKKAHVVDPENRVTNELLKDAQGHQLYMPGSIDRLKADIEILSSSKEALDALRTIKKVLDAGREEPVKYPTRPDILSRYASASYIDDDEDEMNNPIQDDDLDMEY